MELDVEGLFARTHADDTAIILKNWEAAQPKLEIIYGINLISGLKLSYSKRMGDKEKEGNEEQLYMGADTWKDMEIQFAKRLGFFLGPDKKNTSWRKPLAKFKGRVNMWQDQAIRLRWQARVHTTFIPPTLLFIAQLEKPDDEIVKAAESALTQIAKGPTR